MIPIVDLTNFSLTGRQLIEASAGTGKTYTITSLFVRLLLEKPLSISNILVVTFSDAATEELKIRIRSRLQDTLTALDKPSEDSFLSQLVSKIEEKKLARLKLETALKTFDEAAIFTIHGFCKKILQDSALESFSFFDIQLNPDSHPTLKEIVDDFWRIHLYKSSFLFIHYLSQEKFNRTYLFRFILELVRRPFIPILPSQTFHPSRNQDILEKQLLSKFEEATTVWKNVESEIKQSFSSRKEKLLLKDLTSYLANRKPLLKRIGTRSVTEVLTEFIQTLDIKFYDHHPFYEICKTLSQNRTEICRIFNLNLLALKQELANYLRNELDQRNRRKNQRFFDDLLLDLFKALKNNNSRDLKKVIRRSYQAVLIDEFQDTDSIQYEIFDSIYRGTESPLFFIGDPKQAIYGFRGGDIFAYLKASQNISSQFTLNQNWRSGENMVRAVNTFFQKVHNPFVFPEISFNPVRSAGEHLFLDKNQTDNSPLKIWFWKRPVQSPSKVINKNEVDRELPGLIASEVVRLLKAGVQEEMFVEGRSLSPKDIAILVRTNEQSSLVQAALRDRKVPSILSNKTSIFHTLEACELARILFAVADCGNQSKIRAAVETDLLGRCLSQPNLPDNVRTNWESKLKEFSNYRDLWLKEGFIHMMRILIANENVRSNLLIFSEGERRLSNLFHLVEIIQQQTLSQSSNMESILHWLEQKRNEDKISSSEEEKVRLESDEAAVIIQTVHNSKGLEYPIVFCPFSFYTKDESTRLNYTLFHNRKNYQIQMDIGSKQFEKHQKLSQEESLAEEVRLLYVSMTRAKYRCYLVWGALKDSEKSAMGYLLNSQKCMKEITDEKIEKDLKKLVLDSKGSIEILHLPEVTDAIYSFNMDLTNDYQCRNFKGIDTKTRGIYSFSSLISGRNETAEFPDRDGSSPGVKEIEEMITTPEFSIMNFPKGLQAGNFFHSLFESIDFNSKSILSRQYLVREKLRQFGFEEVWCDPVCQLIDRVLSIPLLNNGNDLVLAGLRPNQRLHELAYTFPSVNSSIKKLQEVFASHRVSQLSRSFSKKLDQLQMAPGEGLMKGFIDMVFWSNNRYFLVDWKSNFLGNQLADYKQNILTKVMEKEFYFLQYHLYTVALHRYLSFRLPMYDYDRHFGGIFYIFLRGIDPEKGSNFGIYRDYPSRDLILALDQCLTPDPVFPPKESSNI